MKSFILFLFVVIPAGLTNLLECTDLYSQFGDSLCVSGSIEYLSSGPFVHKIGEEATKPFSKDDLNQLIYYIDDWQATQKPTSIVHELAAYHGISYNYELVKEEGLPHDKTFTFSLTFDDETYYGTGKSHKEARRNAALEALKNTKYELPPQKVVQSNLYKNAVSELNEIASQNGWKVEYTVETEQSVYNSVRLRRKSVIVSSNLISKLNDTSSLNVSKIPDSSPSKPPFYIGVSVADRFFYGEGNSKQIAKLEAAQKALDSLHDDPIPVTVSDIIRNKEANKSPLSRLHELSNKLKITFSIDLLNEEGPSHDKTFFMKCTFGDFTTEGSGKSKKKAKQDAAEKMLNVLEEERPDFLSQYSQAAIKNPSKSSKRNKKKHPMKPTDWDHVYERVGDFISGASSYFRTEDEGSDEDAKPKGSKKKLKSKRSQQGFDGSYKEKLLFLAAHLESQVNFLQGKPAVTGHFCSVISIDTLKPYVCIGEGLTENESKEKASFALLTMLQKLTFADIINIEDEARYPFKSINEILALQESYANNLKSQEKEEL